MKMINDKEAYVREIQRFIIGIDRDTAVVENGIYDEKSKLAVRNFKEQNGLVQDSTVDYETYTLLYEKYKESKINQSRTLRRGDSGEDVTMLNTMLSSVGGEYSDVVKPPVSDYYSERTEMAVLRMREIFDMERATYADLVFYERLRLEYETVNEVKKDESER